MVDIEFSVSGSCFNAFYIEYPDGSYSSEPITYTPSGFPHLNIVETDNYSDGYHLEDASTVVYTVNVFSNQITGAKQECKSIMALVDKQMSKFGFERLFCDQTKNADSRIYRMTARYRGIAVFQEKKYDVERYLIFKS